MCASRAHIPGEGGYRSSCESHPLTRIAQARPDLSQPKSDLSDFGQLKMPNSGKPEFGRERCRKLRRRVMIERHPNLQVVLRLTARYDRAADQFA